LLGGGRSNLPGNAPAKKRAEGEQSNQNQLSLAKDRPPGWRG
jgi:hypothetical protein